jgi:hypothetical protein
MAPPTKLPRIASITPQQAAEYATELLSGHIARLMMHLDPGIVWRAPEPAASSIGFTTALLTEYARTGRDPEGPGLVRDRIQDICSAIYSQAGRPGTFEAPDLEVAVDAGEPTDVLSVVIVAAWARLGLEEGRALTKRELAVLASLSLRQVRALAASGEIACAEDGRVPAKEARRWLRARGVAGMPGGSSNSGGERALRDSRRVDRRVSSPSACPTCGREFRTEAGLGLHLRHSRRRGDHGGER